MIRKMHIAFSIIFAVIVGCTPRPTPQATPVTPVAPREPDPLHMIHLLAQPTSLITLEEIPVAASVSDIKIDRGINVKQAPPLTPDNLGTLLDSARPLNPTNEAIRVFHYAPWHDATFKGPKGEYRMKLFLGGRGFLLLPDGKVGAFDFTHPE